MKKLISFSKLFFHPSHPLAKLWVTREDAQHISTTVNSFDCLDEEVDCVFLGHSLWSYFSFLIKQHIVELSNSLFELFYLEIVLFVSCVHHHL